MDEKHHREFHDESELQELATQRRIAAALEEIVSWLRELATRTRKK